VQRSAIQLRLSIAGRWVIVNGELDDLGVLKVLSSLTVVTEERVERSERFSTYP
jgi:hypothetical protein